MQWRARFFEESPLFAPIREPAELFADLAAFPSPEAIDARLAARAGVRFVRKHQRDKALYDARIVNDRVVPTRAGSWHDLLNALVWSSFPRAKAALHARQHELVVPGAPRRTREGDALAMLDEGGALRLPGGATVVFGHAIFEGLVLGRPTPIAAGLELDGEGDLDARLAARLGRPQALRSPAQLSRVVLPPRL